MANRVLIVAVRPMKLLVTVMLACAILLVVGGLNRVMAPGEENLPPLLGMTVVIDPGHGGVDPGCHLGTWFEKDIVLDIGLRLYDELRHQGAEVILTRQSDTAMDHLNHTEPTRHRRDLAARVQIANESPAEILISLHVNAARSSQLGGALLFYQRGSESSKRLAQAILPHIAQVVPGNQNGVLPADFYVLRHAQSTAVLIEVGFITHPADHAIITSPQGISALASAINTGIIDYMTHATLAVATDLSPDFSLIATHSMCTMAASIGSTASIVSIASMEEST